MFEEGPDEFHKYNFDYNVFTSCIAALKAEGVPVDGLANGR